MRIITKCDGVKDNFDIPPEVKVLVHNVGIRVDAPDAYTISAEDTKKCMQEISQKAWVHISTGPVFLHLFGIICPMVNLPETVETLREDYSDGVIHICGLIILLVEAIWAKHPEIFIKYPETFLHPEQQQKLGILFTEIDKLRGLK